MHSWITVGLVTSDTRKCYENTRLLALVPTAFLVFTPGFHKLSVVFLLLDGNTIFRIESDILKLKRWFLADICFKMLSCTLLKRTKIFQL